ncbi:MAG: hypothetical protein GVY36_18255 [Verrucomicrobia bacterium]|nr:hypothetical protein [Verrucomicrobiota bacterium]
MREVGMLAQMGRIEDALALELRVVSEKDRPPENIEATVNRRLASHRITAAIRNGIDLDIAIERTPDVDPGVLSISALDLLGRNPYGPRTSPRIIPDDQVLGVVSDMAERIARMAQEEPERPQTSHLMYAAELQTALGNRTEVIQLLEALPQTTDPRINPSEDLIRLVGSQDALRLYREAGGSRPNILLTAASAETDLSLATEYLERAFTEFSSEEPWPDFDWMERTVERAAHLGLQAHALQLAHEMGNQADTAPSAFPVFPHIRTAQALMIAGADQGEVKDRLARAQSFFPQDDRMIVGIGLVSGAIVWGSSGLDAQARREIANLWAQMGENDATIQIMDGIDDPVFAWNDMLTSEIPIDTLDGLLDAASDALSREEHAYIRAQHAQEMLFFGGTEKQRLWAQETATALLQTEELDGDRAVLIYSTLTRIGARLGDREIQTMALEGMAQAALNSREFSDLISAGYQWHQSGLVP